jgi:hypothetical protein
MNERAVEVLVKAALGGVPQARGKYVSGRKVCALGALGFRGPGQQPNQDVLALAREFGLRTDRVACPLCDEAEFRVHGDEASIVMHMNDDHGADFLTIARKLGPDAA